MEDALHARLNAAVSALARVTGVGRYPPNFQVEVPDVALRRAKGDVDTLTVGDIRHHLTLKGTVKVAWVWRTAVNWVLEAGTLMDALPLAYDPHAPGFLVDGRPVATGFVYDRDAEGLNRWTDSGPGILVNPLALPDHWVVGDLMDVAIHEAAHLVVAGHGEAFTAVESQVRRDLRRMVTDREVGAAARAALREALV